MGEFVGFVLLLRWNRVLTWLLISCGGAATVTCLRFCAPTCDLGAFV